MIDHRCPALTAVPSWVASNRSSTLVCVAHVPDAAPLPGPAQRCRKMVVASRPHKRLRCQGLRVWA